MSMVVEEGGYAVITVIIILALLALLLVFSPLLLRTSLYQSFISLISGG
ncbi:MAG: hypothetical protein J4469_02050 [Candidatus Aenigmarchaeota archaeon]|nr:hypothetical protein [Candidatus Aenigmarchaeota archaeon]